MVKGQPAVRETRLPPLSWKDPLEKGMATMPVFFFSLIFYQLEANYFIVAVFAIH